VAGRDRPEVENLIGFFVNTLAIRADLSGNPTFAQHLDRVRHQTMAAFAHQDVPFERVVAELSPARDARRNPLVQVMFQLLNGGRQGWQLAGLAAEPFGSATGTTAFDLECDLIERDGGLAGGLNFSRDLFDRVRIERLAECFVWLLSEAAKDPDRPLDQLESLNSLSSLNGIDAAEPPRAEPVTRPSASRGEPQTVLQESVARLWCEVLGLERVGIDDNFFDVGGHSMSAVKITRLVQERLGVRIPLEAVFDRPTVAELAQAVAEIGVADSAADEVHRLVAAMSDEEVAQMLRETENDDGR
jgi:syringomycin synthetase protein SyrE